MSSRRKHDVVAIQDRDYGYSVSVDSTGRMSVTSVAVPPTSTTPVSQTQYGSVSTTEDFFYVIPNGVVLTIQRFSGGSGQNVNGSVVELYYAPNGNTTGISVIDTIFCYGSSDQHDLNEVFTGDGTRAILIRRRRLGGGSTEIFGRFEGYYI